MHSFIFDPFYVDQNTQQFKLAQIFLYSNSFYLFDAYFSINKWQFMVYYPDCSLWNILLLL
jgi:hypothetical protein